MTDHSENKPFFQNSAQQFSQEHVKILDDKTLFDGFFKVRGFRLQHRLFEGGWSEAMHRERFERGNAAGILLYDPDNDLLALVEQFRIGAIGHDCSPWLLELVAGIIEPGETGEDVAQREAVEEAGCETKSIIPICKYFSSPGGCDEQIELFCGRVDLSGRESGIYGLPAEHEDIRLHIVTVDQALDLLANNHIRNGLTLIALQWLALNRQSLQQRWGA